jgi:hypothetical protein
VEKKYRNEWIWQKTAKSPDKKAIARVLLQHEVTKIDIYIVVNDNNEREICKEKVISELPDEYAYSGCLGEIKWNSNKEVILISKNKDRKWQVKL